MTDGGEGAWTFGRDFSTPGHALRGPATAGPLTPARDGERKLKNNERKPFANSIGEPVERTVFFVRGCSSYPQSLGDTSASQRIVRRRCDAIKSHLLLGYNTAGTFKYSPRLPLMAPRFGHTIQSHQGSL